MLEMKIKNNKKLIPAKVLKIPCRDILILLLKL
jgi:hypothetical protein